VTAVDAGGHPASSAFEVGLGWSTMQSTYSRPAGHTRLFREAREEAQFAEELGFDVTWFAEHHHVNDGYLPSVLPACANVAAATHRIKVGTGILILPHHGAERVIRAAAAIDDMAPGRLRVALGTGYWPDEYAATGVAFRDRFKIFKREFADLVRDENRRRLRGAEVWIGQTSLAGARRAGRHGLAMLVPGIDPDTYAERRACYLDAWAGDDPRGPRMQPFFDVWVDDDPRRLEYVQGRITQAWRTYGMQWAEAPEAVDSYKGHAAVDTIEAKMAEREALVAKFSARTIAGPPSKVLDELAPYLDAGAEGMSFRIKVEGMPTTELRRCMERIAVDVIPALKAGR
jgi:alkanesulfonate monooxygenase SsuD/methylene tetrahydromethanopterin reductase-like flavin-dependent oxidoreductase (luciferase family)